MRPEREFYQRELADAAGTGLFAVQRELARLERAGLLVKTRRGNRAYYRTERRHPAYEDLKRLIVKTVGVGDALRAALAPLRDRVRAAFIYGSFAAGAETSASDIDLLLVGDLTSREAAAVLGPVGRGLGREFNPAVYPTAEFRKKARAGHPFVSAVIREAKIFLVGDEHDLAGLIG